jgi:hypothetical protein
LSRLPVRKTGSRHINVGRKPELVSGPGQPPPGFRGAHTSGSEWPWYWASMKILDPLRDPRVGPFFGGRNWKYQAVEFAGAVRVAAVDFVYYLPGQMIGVRIQTDRYHLSAGVEKQGYDQVQRRNLSRLLDVRDVFERDFMKDPSGEAACRLLIDTLGGRDRLDPISTGTYLPTRGYLAS